jgi:hypothetical protein
MMIGHEQADTSARHKTRTRKSQLGQPIQPIPALLTEFEMQVDRLGLSRAEYQVSAELKRWCERNRNRCYVPEWLL